METLKNQVRKTPVVVAILFGFALALRLYHLSTLGLWRDELATHFFASTSLWQTLRACFTEEPNPGLYYFFMHFWVRVFGDSEFMLRLPSVIFGSVSVAMLYLVGRRFFSTRVGFVAALLASTMPLQIRYAQEARVYALFSMIALVSVYFIPLRSKWPTPRSPYFFAISNFFLLYSHPYAVWLFGAQMLFVAYHYWMSSAETERDPMFKRHCAVAFITPFILAMPWYVNMMLHYDVYRQQFKWINEFALLNPVKIVEMYFGFAPIPMLEEQISPAASIGGYLLVGFVAAVFLMSFRFGRRESTHFRRSAAFLGTWIALSILLPLGVGLFWNKHFILRYSLPTSFAVYLLFAANMNWIFRRFRWSLVPVCCLIVLFGQMRTWDFYTHFQKESWRDALVAIRDKDPDPNHPIVVIPAEFMVLLKKDPTVTTPSTTSFINYYADRVLGANGRNRIQYAEYQDEANAIVKKAGSGWVVQPPWYVGRKDPQAGRLPASEPKPVDHIEVPNVDIVRYQVN